jgi:photosystem II stability/assembly factor-like uncharacterized protein
MAEQTKAIWVGTREDGIFKLSRKNGGWTQSEPSLKGKGLMCLVVDSSGDKLYAGFFKDGVYGSTDGGKSWQKKSDGLIESDIRSLAIHPRDPKTLFAGSSGTPPALFVSHNGGESWEEIPSYRQTEVSKRAYFPVPPHVGHVRTITFNPGNPDLMYTGIEVSGLLTSKDGGKTWTEPPGPISQDIHRIIIHPAKPNRVVASTADDTPPYDLRGGHGAYVSEDYGQNWKQCNSGLGIRTYCEDAIAFDPNDPDTVYIVTADGVPPYWGDPRIMQEGFKSGFVYWVAPLKDTRPTGADVMVFRSRNGGQSWEPMMNGLPGPLFEMIWAMDIAPGREMFMGSTSGRIFRAEEPGAPWTEVAQGLPIITHLKVAP